MHAVTIITPPILFYPGDVGREGTKSTVRLVLESGIESDSDSDDEPLSRTLSESWRIRLQASRLAKAECVDDGSSDDEQPRLGFRTKAAALRAAAKRI